MNLESSENNDDDILKYFHIVYMYGLWETKKIGSG
jgi:hypothetical protein